MINVGVTLELTPSLNNNGGISLDIRQVVEQPNGSVTIANVGDVPVTRRTEGSAKTTVPYGDVILLDGSVEEHDAPAHSNKAKRILGGLFHHSEAATNEVIVLIRPKILPTPEAAVQLSEAGKNQMPRIRPAERKIQALKHLEKNPRSEQ